MVVILKMSKCVFNYLLLAAQVSIIRTGRPIGIIFSELKSGFYILKKSKKRYYHFYILPGDCVCYL